MVNVVILFTVLSLIQSTSAATADKTQSTNTTNSPKTDLQDVPLDDEQEYPEKQDQRNYGILPRKPQINIGDDQGCKFCAILCS